VYRDSTQARKLALHDMRIAIDAHSVGARLAGNETYAVNLIEALAEIDQSNQYTLYVTKESGGSSGLRIAGQILRCNGRCPTRRWCAFRSRLSRELRRHPVDVLHVQYTAPPFAPCPIVATIHDLAFEHLPETFNRAAGCSCG
jgi:hypothetical protein